MLIPLQRTCLRVTRNTDCTLPPSMGISSHRGTIYPPSPSRTLVSAAPALCSVLCALCSVLCALCSVLCALCSVLCALCSVICALCFCRYARSVNSEVIEVSSLTGKNVNDAFTKVALTQQFVFSVAHTLSEQC